MADIALGVAGLGGLASLVKACQEATEQFESYRDFQHESRIVMNRFHVYKHKFRKWADYVGIVDNKLNEKHHTSLDDRDEASLISRTLFDIQETLKNIEATSTTLGESNNPRDCINLLGSLQRRPTGQSPNSASVSRIQRASWALVKNTKFSKQVHTFTLLVEDLHTVIPIPQWMDNDTGLLSGIAVKIRIRLTMVVQTRQEVTDWLGPISSDHQYGTHLSARLDGTCEWIVHRSAYSKWADHEFPSGAAKILWIHGPAGHGKSVLCARCIQSLETRSELAVAYFFCSSNVEAQQNPLVILRSLIRQLVMCNQSALELATKQYRHSNSIPASPSDLWGLLRLIVNRVSNCIFVIDGFDECNPPDGHVGRAGSTLQRNQFLAKLKTEVAHTTTRILLVSRDEADIRSQMCPNVASLTKETIDEYKITLEDVRYDIQRFAKSTVKGRLKKKDDTFQEELASLMAKRCKGMFLWIKLKEQELLPGTGKKRLLKLIEDTPSGLEQAYDQSWKNLIDQPRQDRSRALAILRWTLFALRPLTVLEMKEALIVTLENDVNDLADDLADDLEEPIDDDFVTTQILGPCGSFLEIRDLERPIDSRTIHLVHFSVKEFLLRTTSESSLSTAHDLVFSDQATQNNHLASNCIWYLNFGNVWSSFEKDHTSRPFLDYAVKSWDKHLSSAGDVSPETIKLINQFFEPGNPNWNAWRERFESTQDNRKQESNPGGPLYYAALFGLVDTIKWLREERNEDPNAIGGLYGTALQAACAKGHRSAVKQLCNSGVNINIEGGRHGTAINAAAYCRHQSIVQDLANLEADIEIADIHGWTPLRSATHNGHLEMVNVLLDKGANIATIDKNGLTPLHSAARNDHLEVMKVLLHKRANIASVDTNGWTPLHSAVYEGHIQVVQLLLDKGADTATFSSDGWTPLRLAAFEGHLEVVQVLLDKGANIARADKEGWTPLHSAAFKSHLEVVQLLLDKGADPTVITSDGWSPLHSAANGNHFDYSDMMRDWVKDIVDSGFTQWAALELAKENRRVELMKLLLDKGADIAVANSNKWTPLHAAAEKGHVEIVEFLLDKGANIAVADSNKWTPLHAAAAQGHVEIVKFLLDRGANIGVADSTGRTPLNVAAYYGNCETVKLLLDEGADIAVADSTGWTSLHAAVKNYHFEIVKLLLDKGADIAVADSTKRTPLHAAVKNGHFEIVKLLLDKGADIAVADSTKWTPLHSAVKNGHFEIVKLLLDKGADIAVADSMGWTPLHWAAYKGEFETVKVLLARITAKKTMETTSLSSNEAGNVSTANTSPADEKDELSLSLNRKTLMNQTPLHLAASKYRKEIFGYLLSQSPDVNLHDGYGLTCFDYVRHNIDIIQLMESMKTPYYFTEISVQRSHIVESLIRISSQIQSEPWLLKSGSLQYNLGHCLLLLHDVEAACHCFQEGSSALCNNCARSCKPGDWYACMECTDTDLCNKCMKLYPTLPTAIPGCTQHKFVEIKEKPAPDPSAVTPAPDEAEKAELQWSEELRLQYISISNSGQSLHEVARDVDIT
jgi:ankyrin repeat protein